MKHRAWWILVSCLLLAALIPFFSWIKERYAAPTPEPSAWGGYYDEPFTLELYAAASGRIYYTTDGSLPTTDSALYQDGIRLEDRSQEPNVYTSVQNVVTDWLDYTPSDTPVAKGTVVRAIFVNDLGMVSQVLTQTYFIGVQPPERGYTLSLVFDDEDLFGDEGIYVTGKAYDEWYLSGGSEEEAPLPNFQQQWEVTAIAELMGESGDVMNQTVGLRIQGRSTRSEEKKPFALTAREEYGGSNVFDVALFDGVTTHSVMLKRYLTDVIVADIVADRDVAVLHSQPVTLYLNGEFWYNCYMMERYDQQYFRQYYQVSDRWLVKDGVPNEDTEDGAIQAAYDEYMYWVETSDPLDLEQWEAILEETDLQSYIDFMVINYYLCNVDMAEYTNYVVWRSSYAGNGAYEDERWRWCIYDIGALEWIPDYPARETVNLFSEQYMYSQMGMYNALKNSPEFCRQFVLSFMDMVNNNFQPEKVEPILEKYGQTLDWMDGFFLKRAAYAVTYLAEEFDLTGTLETVQITTGNPEMGTVTVNTSTIDLSEGSWSGQYFTDYPITVTASANAGYRFLGWAGDAADTAETLTLTVDGGLNLEAVFVED